MPRSNPERRLFLALTLGTAKCQVPGVPACPGLGRAGRWSLKGSATRFPRLDGPGSQKCPFLVGPVAVHPRSFLFMHPCSIHCLLGQSSTLIPFWFLEVSQGTGAHADHAANPEVPEPPHMCWPRGRHSLQSLLWVWIPSQTPAKRARPTVSGSRKKSRTPRV